MPPSTAIVAEPEDASRPAGRLTRAAIGAEASGAFAATVVALPQALSLGVLAFATLGPQYAGAGVVAALMASVVGNLVAGTTYAVRCQIVGARSSTTALVAGSMAMLAAHPALSAGGALDVTALLALVFAAVALSGVLQVLLGMTSLGRAIKYVPYPVVAGFMNGVAIVIVLSQVRAVLGLEGQQPLGTTLGELGAARWGSVATALAALATILALPRYTRRVPPLVGGLLAGIAVHYTIAAVAPGSVGAIVGPLPDILPALAEAPGRLAALAGADASLLWKIVAPQAVLLGVVGALDGLLATVVTDGVTRGRHDSNRVLVGQGLGNIAGGLLGALPSQSNSHTPIANFQAGGRTRLATVLHAGFALLALLAAGAAVADIPIAALAGIMLYIAYSLVDRWSSDLLRRMRGSQDGAEVATNIAIVAIVAIALVAMNVMAALAIGIAASVALLVVKLSGSPVRRHLDGATRTSHKVRSAAAREALRALAPGIRVMELQGEIFFGTADNLLGEVEALPAGTRYVILDFRRVHQIDASGARVLGVVGQRAARRGIDVVLAEVRPDERRGRYLHALGIDASIPPQRWFADLDRALEWTEDQLLRQSRFQEAVDEIALEDMAFFEGLAPAEIERLAAALERRELASGEPVFLEGEEGDRLYLIARGAVSIKARLPGEARARRLATFTPGVMFGEMALLEGKRRSADAFAKGERVVLYALTAARFEEIVRDDPRLGAHIHRNLARELAARLRHTTEALRALE